jgi:hypothetical protein
MFRRVVKRRRGGSTDDESAATPRPRTLPPALEVDQGLKRSAQPRPPAPGEVDPALESH